MDSALLWAIYACFGFAILCQVLSMVTREVSWVDRLWSITPPLYTILFAALAKDLDFRLLLMAVLTSAWGTRLTLNFARKGGYAKGGEDYRWNVLRQKMTTAQFAAFNLVFINTIQHGLLLLLAMPSWIALQNQGTPLGLLDALATTLFLLFLVFETIADQQQWNFHQQKEARAGAPPEFLSSGLFRYSRHPNFFCEQALWWSFYVFGVASGAPWLNVSLAGPVLLTILFHGSTAFTEKITASKYAGYADYRRRTSRLIPWFPGR